jgi:hypothetical protein
MNEELVSPEKLLELAQAYGREYEAITEAHAKRYIIGAFIIVAVCVLGPVAWFVVIL